MVIENCKTEKQQVCGTGKQQVSVQTPENFPDAKQTGNCSAIWVWEDACGTGIKENGFEKYFIVIGFGESAVFEDV